MNTSLNGRVFVSHSSRDLFIVERLIDLLQIGTGISDPQLFCSNTPGLDIPAGKGFMDYIKQMLREAILTVHLITPSFLESQYCLLELGAAWEEGKSFPLIVPPLSLERLQQGPLGGMQLKTLDGPGLDSLRDALSDALALNKTVARWNNRRDDFLGHFKSLPAHKQPFTDIATVGVRGHHLELWKLTEDGSIYHMWFPVYADKPWWSEWHEFDAPTNAVSLAAASSGPQHATIFVLDDRGRVWHQWWEDRVGWKGWYRFDGSVQGPISASSRNDGHLEIYARSFSGSGISHRWLEDSGKWSGWNVIE